MAYASPDIRISLQTQDNRNRVAASADPASDAKNSSLEHLALSLNYLMRWKVGWSCRSSECGIPALKIKVRFYDPLHLWNV